jgi:hypothetical protein
MNDILIYFILVIVKFLNPILIIIILLNATDQVSVILLCAILLNVEAHEGLTVLMRSVKFHAQITFSSVLKNDFEMIFLKMISLPPFVQQMSFSNVSN